MTIIYKMVLFLAKRFLLLFFIFYDCVLKKRIMHMGLSLNYIKMYLNTLKILDVHND